MSDVEKSYRMLSDVESELQSVWDDVFSKSDADAKFQLLKSEIDSIKIREHFETMQEMQMVALNNILDQN